MKSQANEEVVDNRPIASLIHSHEAGGSDRGFGGDAAVQATFRSVAEGCWLYDQSERLEGIPELARLASPHLVCLHIIWRLDDAVERRDDRGARTFAMQSC